MSYPQSLTGVITYNGQTNTSYDYTCQFLGWPTTELTLKIDSTPAIPKCSFCTTPVAPFIPELNLAYETLEVYNSADNSIPKLANEYPAEDSIQMTGIQISVYNSTSPTTLPWSIFNSNKGAPGQKTIAVNDTNGHGEVDIYFHSQIAPVTTYPETETYPEYAQISSISPTNTGGIPTIYSVTPSLPAGLSLNTTMGVISGTPTVTSPATKYTIIAENSAGSSQAVIYITVTTTTAQRIPASVEVNGIFYDLWLGTGTSGNITGIADAYPAPVGEDINITGWTITGTYSNVNKTAQTVNLTFTIYEPGNSNVTYSGLASLGF